MTIKKIFLEKAKSKIKIMQNEKILIKIMQNEIVEIDFIFGKNTKSEINLENHENIKIMKMKLQCEENAEIKFINKIRAGKNIEIENVFVGKKSKLNQKIFLENDEEKTKLNVKNIFKKTGTVGKILIRSILKKNQKQEIVGDIKVEEKADKTISDLKIETLSLSGNSEIIFLPSLNIKNKKAIAKHSAKIIKIKNNFYLESRGLQSKQIKEIIIQSFKNF